MAMRANTRSVSDGSAAVDIAAGRRGAAAEPVTSSLA